MKNDELLLDALTALESPGLNEYQRINCEAIVHTNLMATSVDDAVRIRGAANVQALRYLHDTFWSQVRDREYQRRILELRSQYPDNKFVVVVGDNHRADLVTALNTGEITTEVDPRIVERMKELLARIRAVQVDDAIDGLTWQE